MQVTSGGGVQKCIMYTYITCYYNVYYDYLYLSTKELSKQYL